MKDDHSFHVRQGPLQKNERGITVHVTIGWQLKEFFTKSNYLTSFCSLNYCNLACRTVSGPNTGALCVLPFIYKVGVVYCWHARRCSRSYCRERSQKENRLPLATAPQVVWALFIGECAKRLLAHSPKALSELIPRISQEKIIQNEKKIWLFLSRLYGMD